MQKQQLTVEALQEHVIQQFSEKRRQNPQYSVARLAKELNIKTPSLQKLLTGKRKLGFLMATQIASALKIEIIKESKRAHRSSKWSSLGFRPMNPESVVQLGWINLVILEMIKLEDFEPRSEWLAKRLGLTVAMVDDILKAMEVDGILLRDGDRWIDELENSTFAATAFITSPKLRDLQKQVLGLSTQALETVAYDEREHSCIFFPVSKTNIAKMKRKIRDFRTEFAILEENNKQPKNDVYGLQISLFPVTRNSTTRENKND